MACKVCGYEDGEHNPEAHVAELCSEYSHVDDERYRMSDAEIEALAEEEEQQFWRENDMVQEE